MVRYLCHAGQINTLIFVHTEPTHARERELYRATIGHRRVRERFNWTLVFFVGVGPSANVSAEATEYGDLVQLPFLDSYRNLTYKFVYGMRWVLLHCPDVRWVVKIDDDVFLNVRQLHEYLLVRMPAANNLIHCSVTPWNVVIRNTHSRHYLSLQEYPKAAFPPHCNGWLVIFSTATMLRLYGGAFLVPMHGIDDAYVTGDVAKMVGVQHVDMTSLLCPREDRLYAMLRGELLGASFTGRGKWRTRLELWKTLAMVEHPVKYSEAIRETLKDLNIKKLTLLN